MCHVSRPGFSAPRFFDSWSDLIVVWDVRGVLNASGITTTYVRPEMTLCDRGEVKIQLLTALTLFCLVLSYCLALSRFYCSALPLPYRTSLSCFDFVSPSVSHFTSFCCLSVLSYCLALSCFYCSALPYPILAIPYLTALL